MDKIKDIITTTLGAVGMALGALFVLGLLLAASFLFFAGLFALWIKLFGSPESFWGFVLCGWVIHTVLCVLFHDNKVQRLG